MGPNSISSSVSLDLGSLLGGLFDQVNGSIQEATNDLKRAGIELEIEAGKEIGLAIENAKNAYKDCLNETIDKVKKEAKDTFDRLNSMVEKFQRGTQEEVEGLALQAQQIINTLPFSSKMPQLTKVQPRYLVIDDLARSSLVTFKGNFPTSEKHGFEPSLNFLDRKCTLIDMTTQSLTFQVPHRAFEDQEKERFSFITGKLQVPWDDGIIWSHKTEFDYRVGLGALPQIAGNVSVEYLNKEKVRDFQKTITSEYVYDGNNWYPEHWHTLTEHIYPTPGWTIDASKKPSLTCRDIHGRHKQGIVSVSPNEIVIEVGLYCKTGQDIGKVGVQVSFDEYQDRVKEKVRNEKFEINWRDSRLLEPLKEEVISKVSFDAYNGAHQEFGAPDLSRDILKIQAEGNGKWKVWAEAPKEMQLKTADLSHALKGKLETLQKLIHLQHLSNVPAELKALAKPIDHS